MPTRATLRRFLPLAVAAFAALAIGTPLAAGAEGGGANNVVLVTGTADGSTLARSGLEVGRAGGPTIASANIAAATSRACTQQQLAAMRGQIADLAASGLPPDELTSRLDAVAAEFKATIAGSLNPVNGAATVRVDTTAAA